MHHFKTMIYSISLDYIAVSVQGDLILPQLQKQCLSEMDCIPAVMCMSWWINGMYHLWTLAVIYGLVNAIFLVLKTNLCKCFEILENCCLMKLLWNAVKIIFALPKMVWQQFTSKVGKFKTSWCQVSSGHTPKIIKICFSDY